MEPPIPIHNTLGPIPCIIQRVSNLSATLHRYEKHIPKSFHHINAYWMFSSAKMNFTFHKADDPSSLNIVLTQSENPLYWFPAPCQMSKNEKWKSIQEEQCCSFSMCCVFISYDIPEPLAWFWLRPEEWWKLQWQHQQLHQALRSLDHLDLFSPVLNISIS